jgi:hypothetical protein
MWQPEGVKPISRPVASRSQAARGLGRSALYPCHRDDYSGLDPATIGREPAAANNSPAMRGHESIKVSEHQESPA